MNRIASLAFALGLAGLAHPVLGADEEPEEPQAPPAQVYLLATINQGGLEKIAMQSMEACQTAAGEIYEKSNDYSGPSLYIYCIADDGNVWAFDRWNEDD